MQEDWHSLDIKFLFFVFVGGGLGSIARYLCAIFLQKFSYFPLGTLFVNVFGAFLMGACIYLFFEKNLSSDWKIFLMSGFLGGFTTFSSFGMEVFFMVKQGYFYKTLLYVCASNFLVFLCVYLGFVFAKKLVN